MSSINFLGNTPFTAENVERRFREQEDRVGRLQSGQTVIKTLNSAISNAISQATAKGSWVRTDSVAVAAGSQNVTFREAVDTTDYQVVSYFVDADNYVSLMPPPTAKTLAYFTNTYSVAGTVIYFARPTQ